MSVIYKKKSPDVFKQLKEIVAYYFHETYLIDFWWRWRRISDREEVAVSIPTKHFVEDIVTRKTEL